MYIEDLTRLIISYEFKQAFGEFNKLISNNHESKILFVI